MNRILLLYVRIESKSGAFGFFFKKPGGGVDDPFVSLLWSGGWAKTKTYLVFVVIGCYKEK